MSCVDPKGMLDYDALMLLTLQRARTAREAIKIVDELAREYGYQVVRRDVLDRRPE